MTKVKPTSRGSRFDLNRNGDLSQEELRDAKELLLLELQEEKWDTQRRMGWAALSGLLGFTGVLFSPLLTDGRVSALSGAFDMFALSMAGIVGAVVGVTTWMTNSRMQTYGGYHDDDDYSGHRYGKYGSTF